MNRFGGPAFLLDRDNINTDEIIPAKYLTEISKQALKPHLLEDLLLGDRKFDNQSKELQNAAVLVTRKNFGCGSSREHAVWVLEVNNINVVIAESFARIFRQNMFNCGIMAIELSKNAIDEVFTLPQPLVARVDLERSCIDFDLAKADADGRQMISYPFVLNEFNKALVTAGGWLAYADERY